MKARNMQACTIAFIDGNKNRKIELRANSSQGINKF